MGERERERGKKVCIFHNAGEPFGRTDERAGPNNDSSSGGKEFMLGRASGSNILMAHHNICEFVCV